jgi:hypothetical protein
MAASADPGPAAANERRAGLYFQLYTQGSRPPVRWRLLSGNRRDMGRGAVGHVDEESARLAIKELLVHLDELDPGLVPSAGHRWDFKLSYAGTVLVTSGHGFDRRNRCEQAMRRFVELAREAEIRPGVAVLSTPGLSQPIGRSRSSTRIPGRPTVRPRWSPVHPAIAGESSGSGLLGLVAHDPVGD